MPLRLGRPVNIKRVFRQTVNSVKGWKLFCARLKSAARVLAAFAKSIFSVYRKVWAPPFFTNCAAIWLSLTWGLALPRDLKSALAFTSRNNREPLFTLRSRTTGACEVGCPPVNPLFYGSHLSHPAHWGTPQDGDGMILP